MAHTSKLAQKRAALAALRKEREALIEEMKSGLAEQASTLTAYCDKWSQLWDDEMVSREGWEGVFNTFTSYPCMISSFFRSDYWRENHAVLCAIDSLNRAHERAAAVLSKLACRLNLNGGLIEVSGEHCRKVLIADPSAWLDTKDGRWPYCLDNKPGSIPATDYQQIMEAEVVLRQLRQQLNLCVEDGSAVVAKLFKEEGPGGESVKRFGPIGKAGFNMVDAVSRLKQIADQVRQLPKFLDYESRLNMEKVAGDFVCETIDLGAFDGPEYTDLQNRVRRQQVLFSEDFQRQILFEVAIYFNPDFCGDPQDIFGLVADAIEAEAAKLESAARRPGGKGGGKKLKRAGRKKDPKVQSRNKKIKTDFGKGLDTNAVVEKYGISAALARRLKSDSHKAEKTAENRQS